MTINELKAILIDKGVPQKYYALDGKDHVERNWAIRKSFTHYEVYSIRFGQRFFIYKFKTESEACDFLYNQVIQDCLIRFILECQLMKGYTADECVDCIEILRKYKDTNDVASFQQEMISAGLVSPDAAAPVTWFDKIFWGAWAENKSAPLLNEYENYSKNTSFEELFDWKSKQWVDSAKTAINFWAFGVTSKYVNWMNNWHQISFIPEDYTYEINYDYIEARMDIDAPDLSSNPKWE